MTTRRITPEESAQWHREITPKAFTEIIQPSTIPISREVRGQLDQFGSGVLLEIGDKSFIVSAAHVLDWAALHEQPLCVPRSPAPTPPLWLDRAEGYLVTQVPEGRKATDPHMRDHDPLDVGVCVLHPDDATELKKHFRFLRLYQIDHGVPLLPASYITAGFPSRIEDRHNGGHRIMPTPCFAVSNLCDQLPDGAENVVANSIFLTYQRDGFDQEFQEIKAPKLGGISGGGIWRLADPSRLISLWKVDDVKLVGIETSCCYGHYIRGVSIRVVLGLIGNEWPALQSSIELTHGRVEFNLPIPRQTS
ncbi:hypothetical protein J0H58_13380 [bacterium]|nr:hypothetical protein [bacterium]